MTINRAIIAGHITRNVTIRTLKNGTVMASFSVATTEKWKDKEGKYQEFTDYHNIVTFNSSISEQCKNLKTGAMVYIEGRIRISAYEKDGVTKLTPQIEPSLLRVIAEGKNSEIGVDTPKEENKKTDTGTIKNDDIPF